MKDESGFFSSLFDMSFTSLITTRIIKVLYVLAMIVIGLYALGFIIAGFSNSAGLGLAILLIGAPIFTIISLVYTRVLLEVFIALFRIMENSSELVTRAKALEPSGATSPGGSPPTSPGAPPPGGALPV